MKIIKDGNIEHLKNHTCKVCKTVFDLEARDLHFDRTQVFKEGIVGQFFLWSCKSCAGENKLSVLRQDGRRWTTDNWSEDFFSGEIVIS